jgi:hypothetical protein
MEWLSLYFFGSVAMVARRRLNLAVVAGGWNGLQAVSTLFGLAIARRPEIIEK